MSRLTTQVFNCIKDYKLIEPNDKIMVGLSGGKDSFALLRLLSLLKKSIGFELFACHVTLRKKVEISYLNMLESFCNNLEIPLFIRKTDILDYIENHKLKKDICFLCAHYRRKELFLEMEKQKIYKIALGHHRNDAIETFLMNIFYSAQTCTMMPKQSLFREKITLIRPLYTTNEKQILSYVKTNNIPVFEYNCGNSKISKRKEIKDMIANLTSENSKIEYNIFNSMHNINLDYLPKKEK
ncbi:MAG: tRNA lysidine(34) synthetase TilS [Candidatus Muirbacterium halophilum]|nr:tRNA lysidine(34) synthetase TilS [Candidatus Muirbacterium halophilum]MCK9475721.1 tRNA lysidine(34) synthetase TilS [Candidatus Muirbacterium halophilum]